MSRASSRSTVAVATLAALAAALLAPLVAPCVAMAGRAPDVPGPATTACGHAAPPADPGAPGGEAPPADEAPERDGTCCLSATLVPAPPAATAPTLAPATWAAPVATHHGPRRPPVAPAERPPPRPAGDGLFGVLRL